MMVSMHHNYCPSSERMGKKFWRFAFACFFGLRFSFRGRALWRVEVGLHFLLQPLIAAIAGNSPGRAHPWHTWSLRTFWSILHRQIISQLLDLRGCWFFLLPNFFEKNANGGWLLDVLVVPLDRGNTFQVEVSPLVPEPLSFSCNIVTHFPSRKSEIPKKNN